MNSALAPLRAAAFQRRPRFGDVRGVLDRLTEDLEWCCQQGVQLALFPECYLQGYAMDREAIVARSLAVDGHEIRGVLSAVERYPTTIILGLIEQRAASFLNSALVIREGQLLGTYAKTHPNEPGFDAGADYPVFTTHDWSFSINICNDANFPDAALNVSRQGAQLLCYPLNNMLLPKNATKWRFKSVSNLQARAVETGCWVMSSDVVGHHGNQMSYGCTCIVSPNGDVVTRAPEEEEAAVLFDLNPFAP
jgi:5-aminopentanamidase